MDQDWKYLRHVVKIARWLQKNDVTPALRAWLGINDHFLHSTYTVPTTYWDGGGVYRVKQFDNDQL